MIENLLEKQPSSIEDDIYIFGNIEDGGVLMIQMLRFGETVALKKIGTIITFQRMKYQEIY